MYLKAFDHVNVLTGQLDEMMRWYDRVLGFAAGPRPDFERPGAWLYLDELPIVHLIGVDRAPESIEPQIEHFAFRAENLAGFLAHLRSLGIDARLAEVPGLGVTQVNIADPDGNHIHIDFMTAESD